MLNLGTSDLLLWCADQQRDCLIPLGLHHKLELGEDLHS